MFSFLLPLFIHFLGHLQFILIFKPTFPAPISFFPFTFSYYSIKFINHKIYLLSFLSFWFFITWDKIIITHVIKRVFQSWNFNISIILLNIWVNEFARFYSYFIFIKANYSFLSFHFCFELLHLFFLCFFFLFLLYFFFWHSSIIVRWHFQPRMLEHRLSTCPFVRVPFKHGKQKISECFRLRTFEFVFLLQNFVQRPIIQSSYSF